jgi:hypothetical protein
VQAYELSSLKGKSIIQSFVQYFYERFHGSCQFELSRTNYFKLELETFSPLSPIGVTSQARSLLIYQTEENKSLEYGRLILHSCDPGLLKSSITSYNQINNAGSPSIDRPLRYFWNKWLKSFSKLCSVSQSESPELITEIFLANRIKTNSPNDIDYYFIASSKINELISIRV